MVGYDKIQTTARTTTQLCGVTGVGFHLADGGDERVEHLSKNSGNSHGNTFAPSSTAPRTQTWNMSERPKGIACKHWAFVHRDRVGGGQMGASISVPTVDPSFLYSQR